MANFSMFKFRLLQENPDAEITWLHQQYIIHMEYFTEGLQMLFRVYPEALPIGVGIDIQEQLVFISFTVDGEDEPWIARITMSRNASNMLRILTSKDKHPPIYLI